MSDGAYLPSVSAPPAPAKLWHCAQFVRNSSPPSARSASVVSSCSSVGIAGPGAERGDVCRHRQRSRPRCTAPRRAAPARVGAASGIRPVPTWKCTAAAPAPIRVGAVAGALRVQPVARRAALEVEQAPFFHRLLRCGRWGGGRLAHASDGRIRETGHSQRDRDQEEPRQRVPAARGPGCHGQAPPRHLIR